MIELDLELPLAHFPLRVRASLGEGTTGIMGPSGCGKTSLLEAIAGLRPRARGLVSVGGEALLDSRQGLELPAERRGVGYVPQDAGLFPHLTAGENVRFSPKAEAGRVQAAVEILEVAGLLGRYPATLSGGERQRVALARALATSPRVLLLDEPLAGLDAPLRERILPYLLRVRSEWRTPILYVTHSVGEVLALAETALLLRDGSVEAQGSPSELLRSRPEFGRGHEIENLFPGRIEGHDAVAGTTRIVTRAGFAVTAPLAASRAPGSEATAAFRAEDVLVATAPPESLSARNAFEARIESLSGDAADVTLQCVLEASQVPIWARLTAGAVASLKLAQGSRVWLAVKSHSIRLL